MYAYTTVPYTLLFTLCFLIHKYNIRVSSTLLLSLHFLKRVGAFCCALAELPRRSCPAFVVSCILSRCPRVSPTPSPPPSLFLCSYLRERQCKEAKRGERIRKKSRYKGIHLTNCANLFITRKTTATAAGNRCRRHSRSQRGQRQGQGQGLGLGQRQEQRQGTVAAIAVLAGGNKTLQNEIIHTFGSFIMPS